MSVIAIENVPQKVSLKDIVKELKRPICGPFEALNFGKSQNGNHTKICYLRLSETLDPVCAVQNINKANFKSRGKYYAFIPDKVPDIPLGTSKKAMNKRVPAPLRKQMRIAGLNAEGRIIKYTTDEIISELQAKYPGIYCLSEKYDHKLLHNIANTIRSRVEELLKKFPELEESCFKATRAYRRAHPGAGDLPLVQGAAHALQDEAGTARQPVTESELTTATTMHRALDLPLDKVKPLCDRYTAKILAKMTEHVDGLDTTISQIDMEEDIARKQVRQELKKLKPFLSLIVSQVVSKQFLPQDPKHHRMRIYGEPFLPNKDTMGPFLARFKPKRPMRSKRMFNMLKLAVTPAHYQHLIAMNGTVLNGAKLIIGRSDVIMYKASRFCTGGTVGDGPDGDSDDEHMDDEHDEQEPWDDMEM